MKQITNKEYEEWQKYKAEKAKGKDKQSLSFFADKMN